MGRVLREPFASRPEEGGAVSWERRSRWREQPVWVPERGSAGWV